MSQVSNIAIRRHISAVKSLRSRQQLEIECSNTAAYYPQGIGQVKHFNCTLESMHASKNNQLQPKGLEQAHDSDLYTGMELIGPGQILKFRLYESDSLDHHNHTKCMVSGI